MHERQLCCTKSAKIFSLIAKDQAHEQSNKILQAYGGAVGLYEDPEALTLSMLAGPDIVRVVKEFKTINNPPSKSIAHHEEGHSMQVKFRKDVLAFVEVVQQIGNPFLSINDKLVALDTQIVMEPAVANSMAQIQDLGKVLHAAYVTERLEMCHTCVRYHKAKQCPNFFPIAQTQRQKV